MELLRLLVVGGGVVEGAGTAPTGQEGMSVMEEKGSRWRHEGMGVVGDCCL